MTHAGRRVSAGPVRSAAGPSIRRLTPSEVVALPDGLEETAAPGAEPTPHAATVLTFVDLPAAVETGLDLERVARRLRASARILVGMAHEPLPAALLPLLEALTLTLSAVPQHGRAHVTVDDPAAEAARLARAVQTAPRSALALAGVLRATPLLPVDDGLAVESLAYSMLQSGPEFAAWRAARAPSTVPPPPSDPVLLSDEGDALSITLNRPERRNALGASLRDALIEALETAAADPRLRTVELRGAGPDFCSGGDLDEFGGFADPASAHAIRLARSAGRLVHRNAGRVRARLHGACVGAGIEVPAFAGEVAAEPGSWFRLPELGLGLIPGAGGTVSLPRRIGRWRTAWMALTGDRVSAATAAEWGLVDRMVPTVRA
ncbi:enoyl-CoA hydratase/isomerase family protein [Streptomyces sulphureus]|uniref:enoyl-CoA hydratase/isomerase family protein n=1 Tax=Streptomyces sulphureus TaxID=47758 RepID=UPI000370D0C9|nr:enoyl-CoA hydratase/isomerase family protein [Streptomyces sulphureus]